MFDGQCIWEKIFVSLEKLFLFQYSQTIFHLVFTGNIYVSVFELLSEHFFKRQYLANGTKIQLDAQGLFIFFSHSLVHQLYDYE